MNEEQLEEMFKYIKAVPKVPEDDRTNEYQAPCPCGGTITAWRVKVNGHFRAKCNKCEFKLIE